MDAIASLISDILFRPVQELLKLHDIGLIKEMLLVARYGGIAEGEGSFAALTKRVTMKMYELPIFNPGGQMHRISVTNTTAHFRLQEFFSNPLNRGAIIMSCFLAPLTEDQEDDARMGSYLKEIHVTDSDPTHIPFNWSPFFGDYTTPIHSSIPLNPPMARVVHEAIDSWLDVQASKEHHIKMSTKLLPRETREGLEIFRKVLFEDPSVATSASVELLDTFYGIYVGGGCEMGQRWYSNQIGPRSYFVSGADAHHHAKFTKNMWNDLADALSVTSRRNRTNPGRIHVAELKEVVFYDLTSFTSNLSCQSSFLNRLAIYAEDRTTTLVDPIDGKTEVSMGELIRSYSTLVDCPEFWWNDRSGIFPEVHGVASFLGVFGNIASCNFIHGATILQCCTYEEECGCAGDDVVIVVDEVETVWGCASLLGILAVEKTFLMSDRDVVYLKRRTWLGRDGHLHQSSPFQLPSFLLDAVRGDDPIRRFRESRASTDELLDIASSSIMASFRSAHHLLKREEYMSEILPFMKAYYRRHSFPEEGSVPQYHQIKTSMTRRFIPRLEFFGNPDYIRLTLETLYPGSVTLPDRDSRHSVDIDPSSGTVFLSRGASEVTYLKRMGYLKETGRMSRVYYGPDGLGRIIDEFDRSVRNENRWIRYEVIREIPEWLYGGRWSIQGTYDDPDINYSRGDNLEPEYVSSCMRSMPFARS